MTAFAGEESVPQALCGGDLHACRANYWELGKRQGSFTEGRPEAPLGVNAESNECVQALVSEARGGRVRTEGT